MSQEPDLEELIEQNNSAEQANLSFKEKAVRELKYFVVDGTSAALYYAPFMALTERLSGMNWEEVGTVRTKGAILGFLTGHFYNEVIRKRWAKTIGVNAQSSWLKRKSVDVSLGMATIAPTYAPMLYTAGASAKQMAITLFFGSLVGAVAGLHYDDVSDACRKYLGLQPVFDK